MTPPSPETDTNEIEALLDVPMTPGELRARRSRRISLTMLLVSLGLLFLSVPVGDLAAYVMQQDLAERERAEAVAHPGGQPCAMNWSGSGCNGFFTSLFGLFTGIVVVVSTLPMAVIGCVHARALRAGSGDFGGSTLLFLLNFICVLTAVVALALLLLLMM
ncbi:MAG: hypothetical protein VX641_05020 [Planctomycetota bacterium]|nr:hypothetical protein [Planctomycetota bacterium]